MDIKEHEGDSKHNLFSVSSWNKDSLLVTGPILNLVVPPFHSVDPGRHFSSGGQLDASYSFKGKETIC